MESSKILGRNLPEQMDPDDGVNVENQTKEQPHIPHGTEALDKSADEKLKLWQRSDQPQQPQRADKSQNRRERATDREYAQRHDGEIEDVPAIAKIIERPPPVCGDLESDLCKEDGKHHRVERLEKLAVPGDRRRVRLDSGEQASEEDHCDDHRAEWTGIDDSFSEGAHTVRVAVRREEGSIIVPKQNGESLP